MWYILHRSNEKAAPLADEPEIAQDYIDLQRLRLTSQVDLSYKVDCDRGTYKIGPFILLPISENCFKYGVDNIKKPVIEIAIYLQENKLSIIAKNIYLSGCKIKALNHRELVLGTLFEG